ncbi:MAG: GldM family protein [Taibaiella sp.]|jgi:hypothetical protein
MKKALFVLFYSLISVMLYGQGFAVSSDKMNVAYVGVDNPLTIVAEACDCSNIMASCDNGTLTKKSECHFIFRPEKEGVADIIVAAKTRNGTKSIGTTRYRVKMIPLPRVALGRQSGGFMKAELFKAQKGLSILLDNSELDCTWKILSFRVVIAPKLGEVLQIDNSGPLFNQRVLLSIQRLKTGDKVIFENIKATDQDGLPRSINSMVFTIV